MATCRNCFHCRACHEMYLVAVAQEDDFFERHDAEACEDFVNTDDVVEIPCKCEDCKNYNGHRYCYYFAQTVLDDDFCSYGERK